MRINYWAKFESSKVYHIYNRGINGTNIFYKEENYIYFLQKWAQYFIPFLDVYAYCLMPNHFHFIVSVNDKAFENILECKLGKEFSNYASLNARIAAINNGKLGINDFLELQFKDFFGAFSKAISKQENRTGSLFQQRFKRTEITDNLNIIEKICYLHHNPIHHKFCIDYEEWKFSSFRAFQSSKNTKVQTLLVLKLFSNNEDDLSKLKDTFYKKHLEYKSNFDYNHIDMSII